MKIRKLLASLVLVLSVSFYALAGDMINPGYTTPPKPPTCTNCITSEDESGSWLADAIQTVVPSLLALF